MKTTLVTILSFMVFFSSFAQENLGYQLPPQSILTLADFERAPSVAMDAKKENVLFSYRSTYKSLADLNQAEMSLAGLRINPKTNISSTLVYITNLKVRKFNDVDPLTVKGLPTNPRIAYLTWSPDETKVAFTHTTEKGVELWMLDFATASATKLTDAVLNANLGNPINWYRDNSALLVRMLPKNAASLIDPNNNLPAGPIISNSDGSVSQNRTYQDLLKNPDDESNFVTLTTSELFRVSLSGQTERFLPADMYADESFSPDGNLLLVTTFDKPFSYIVPLNRFPMLSKVYDLQGKSIATVNQVPLNEVMPKGFMAVRAGKRSMAWRADEPATLFYVEALDGGDPAIKVDHRDAMYLWNAPFDGEPTALAKTKLRYAGIEWGNSTVAVLHDQWYDTRRTTSHLINPSKPEQAPRLLVDRNYQDIYSDPGNFQTEKNQYNRYALLMDKNKLFLIGDGYTKNGQFPFVDALDVKTLKTERMYQSAFKDKKEEILSIEDVKKGEVLVRIQSKNEYPNYYLRNLRKRIAPQPITFFSNPFESIKDVHKEVIKYKREDGVQLSGTLYLPVGYDKSKMEKLPLLMWAYPAEYKDKNSAGQTTSNPNEFTFPNYGSFIYWVTRGYAVLDDAAFPIVGEGDKEPNDTFVQQLVANAKAAIDAVDALGYIDRTKVGVGGHSYGAFMTANLLTHSNLFACGVARSGAYNRTLTPFGFQREQRNYWEAKDVYDTMSPFMQAHKMKTPLLLVHGEADNNPGTFTLQTERYFQALKGLGAPARMVILPKESHGYSARENIMHLLWEQEQFFEKYLK